jgi:hypothetical protein
MLPCDIYAFSDDQKKVLDYNPGIPLAAAHNNLIDCHVMAGHFHYRSGEKTVEDQSSRMSIHDAAAKTLILQNG